MEELSTKACHVKAYQEQPEARASCKTKNHSRHEGISLTMRRDFFTIQAAFCSLSVQNHNFITAITIGYPPWLAPRLFSPLTACLT
jgi:hypothetical protein